MQRKARKSNEKHGKMCNRNRGMGPREGTRTDGRATVGWLIDKLKEAEPPLEDIQWGSEFWRYYTRLDYWLISLWWDSNFVLAMSTKFSVPLRPDGFNLEER